jgi:Leucine-rich repeat (LRR) protein
LFFLSVHRDHLQSATSNTISNVKGEIGDVPNGQGGSGSTDASAAVPGRESEPTGGGSQQEGYRRSSSGLSQNSTSSLGSNGSIRDRGKRDVSKQRAEARRLKLDAQIHEVDIGHPVDPNDDGDDAFRFATSNLNRSSNNVIHTSTVEEESDAGTNENSANSPATHLHSNLYSQDGSRRPYNSRINDLPPVSTISANANMASASDHLPHGLDNADNRSIASTISDASSDRGTVIYGRSAGTASAGGSGPAAAPGGIGIATSTVTGVANCQPADASGSTATTVATSSSSNRSKGVLFGKSSSLIFPTGVEPPPTTHGAHASDLMAHKINLLLDQCETVRFPFKKKLNLGSLDLTAAQIPVKDLYGTSLGNSLHKLSLNGNRLSVIPPTLVTCLPVLKTLDLSQCELHQLPERWNLPQLKRLNLSHNRLTDFPEEVSSAGMVVFL